MSIISSICAENDRKIVQKAIAIAKEQMKNKHTPETLRAINEALEIVSKHCNDFIQE